MVGFSGKLRHCHLPNAACHYRHLPNVACYNIDENFLDHSDHVVVGLFCMSALSVFGHNCFTDGLMDPLQLNGPGGKLDWGFFAGIGGVVIGLFPSLFFALDACQQGRKSSSSRGAVLMKRAPSPYTDTECASLSENTSYPTKYKSRSSV